MMRFIEEVLRKGDESGGEEAVRQRPASQTLDGGDEDGR